ncbi:MAG: 50S ribosomal protein L13 [Parcubacteria group bacterium GW2011_GWA2_43_9b]|uniref:Large ribosomal subunit protein uL13 n=1 Tax=Candidatus Portnoybacteria bacterium RIFCSPLOWO2_02_FULL_39_11 TaxID=1802001 RepID=A0A1G2FPF1_9BACT|nr:MAG: 50S ribosomal protein L13 [Parcubacteria group bacterium GW2011_GWA2_43_9b]OGZ39956.1 MAG: 50S ribosomal protein L13 [Candidatus Portnoybacteria bacterium RIFCSPLOWO2_02_FULL_39_11]
MKKEYTIDAKGKILGRLAVEAAVLLRGKNTANFLPRITPENIVKVINTDLMKFTGKKLKQKTYYRHSGYPGGLKEETLEKLFVRDSREVLRLAVYGMLPKNRTRNKTIRNLKLFK